MAAIARVLLELDGNVEDSRMSILRGQFAVMLIVALPEGTDRAKLEQKLSPVREALGLEALTVSPVEKAPAAGPEPTHVLSVYGADHSGIVHAFSTALADRGISITDLETKLAGENEGIYVMLMEIAAADSDETELRTALEAVAEEAGVDVSLRELDADAL